MSEIWVLTKEVNDYNQHGEYYVKAWDHKPTEEELIQAGVPCSDYQKVNKVKNLLETGCSGNTYSIREYEGFFLTREE
jgi:hypothetical protein